MTYPTFGKIKFIIKVQNIQKFKINLIIYLIIIKGPIKQKKKIPQTTTPNGNIKITTVTTTQPTTTAKYYRIFKVNL